MTMSPTERDAEFRRIAKLVQTAERQAAARTGTCPVCTRSITLTRAGKIRQHGARTAEWPRRRNCDGWGKDPAGPANGGSAE